MIYPVDSAIHPLNKWGLRAKKLNFVFFRPRQKRINRQTYIRISDNKSKGFVRLEEAFNSHIHKRIRYIKAIHVLCGPKNMHSARIRSEKCISSVRPYNFSSPPLTLKEVKHDDPYGFYGLQMAIRSVNRLGPSSLTRSDINS